MENELTENMEKTIETSAEAETPIEVPAETSGPQTLEKKKKDFTKWLNLAAFILTLAFFVFCVIALSNSSNTLTVIGSYNMTADNITRAAESVEYFSDMSPINAVETVAFLMVSIILSVCIIIAFVNAIVLFFKIFGMLKFHRPIADAKKAFGKVTKKAGTVMGALLTVVIFGRAFNAGLTPSGKSLVIFGIIFFALSAMMIEMYRAFYLEDGLSIKELLPRIATKLLLGAGAFATALLVVKPYFISDFVNGINDMDSTYNLDYAGTNFAPMGYFARAVLMLFVALFAAGIVRKAMRFGTSETWRRNIGKKLFRKYITLLIFVLLSAIAPVITETIFGTTSVDLVSSVKEALGHDCLAAILVILGGLFVCVCVPDANDMIPEEDKPQEEKKKRKA